MMSVIGAGSSAVNGTTNQHLHRLATATKNVMGKVLTIFLPRVHSCLCVGCPRAASYTRPAQQHQLHPATHFLRSMRFGDLQCNKISQACSTLHVLHNTAQ